MIWLFRFFDFLSIVLPVKVAYLISEILGILTYGLGLYSKGKRNIRKNLKQIGIKSSGFLNFVNFARFIAEFMVMLKLNRKNLRSWIEVIGIERLEREFNQGKGVIVLTGHLGNWELGAVMLSLLGYPTHVISIHYMNKAMADFYERRRKRKGLKVIYIEEGRAMVKALRRGQILALLGDRIYGQTQGIEVNFFGKPAKFPLGAFHLARLTQAPIVVAFALHERGRLRVYFEEPIYLKNKGEVIKGLSLYISILEKYIKKYAHQWYAFDLVWTSD